MYCFEKFQAETKERGEQSGKHHMEIHLRSLGDGGARKWDAPNIVNCVYLVLLALPYQNYQKERMIFTHINLCGYLMIEM